MSATEQSTSAKPTPVSFNNTAESLAQLSDEDFLRSIRWRKAADADLVRTAGEGDLQAFCKRLLRTVPFARRNTNSANRATDLNLWLYSPPYFSGEFQPTLASLYSRSTPQIEKQKIKKIPYKATKKSLATSLRTDAG